MVRKKVYLVLPVMKGGGVEQVSLVLLKHLDRTRYELKLVLFRREGEYLDRVPADVEIIDLHKKNRLSFFGLIVKLARLIRIDKPDILLSSLYYPNIVSVLACILSASRYTKVIICEHNHHKKLLPFKRLRRCAWHLMRYTYRRADRIIAVSRNIKKTLAEDFEIDPHRIVPIYNPMETVEIRRRSREAVRHPFLEKDRRGVTIVGVGRLTRQKNFALLIEALTRVRREIPASLLILGQGGARGALEALTRELGVEQHVAFPGFQQNPYKWMRRADLFVLPSDWEGFGIVIVEAMICGVPVVSTDCPSGPNEIIRDRENGRLVTVGDAAHLAEAIVELARDRELAEKFVRNGFENARRFDFRRTLQQYEHTIEEVAMSDVVCRHLLHPISRCESVSC